jgi:deoxycytidine triphosphate deaminase
MPIGPKKLLEMVKSHGLVTDLSERELTNPEGAGFDLRLGEVYAISGEGFLGIVERQTPDIKKVASFNKKRKSRFTIKPGEYFLVKTVESVNLPDNIGGYLYSRGTLFRSGVQLILSQIAPGYHGELTFGMKNVGDCVVTFEMGARIAHVQFEYVDGGGFLYRGQWKGGRVAATKREIQV